MAVAGANHTTPDPAIGMVTVTGQASGAVTLRRTVTERGGPRLDGCNDAGDLLLTLAFKPGTLTMDGHEVPNTLALISVEPARGGDTESLARTAGRGGFENGIWLAIPVGRTGYANWSSVSGTLTTKHASGGSYRGSFSAVLEPGGEDGHSPAGSFGAPARDQSGKATKPVRITGSWSSCHFGMYDAREAS